MYKSHAICHDKHSIRYCAAVFWSTLCKSKLCNFVTHGNVDFNHTDNRMVNIPCYA